MSLSKTLVSILSLLTLSSCQSNFFKIISSSYVKEYCSCRFVVGQKQKYCHNYASQIIPVSAHAEDTRKKIIDAKALGFESRAQYLGPRKGCRITK